MEILKSEQYISEKLNIKPVSTDRLAKWVKEPEVDDETRQFIEDNNLVWNTSTRRYDCDGGVMISKDIVSDGKLKIRFGKVSGFFRCCDGNLTTLEGAPQEVGGYFNCGNNELTTLKGAPQKVNSYFICSSNKLTTLEGAPNEVGGSFSCNDNKLTTLEGAPQEVEDDFDCSHNELTTLEHAPQKVGGDVYCSNNPNLVLPKKKPSWLKGKIKK